MITGAAPSRGGSLHGRDIICFSNDWNGDPYSKTHLMRRLARTNRVLWINSIGSRAPNFSRRDIKRLWQKLCAAARPLENPAPNLYVLNPVAVPWHGWCWTHVLNRYLLRGQITSAMCRLGFCNPISWVFVPWASVVVGTLGEQLIIYHCVDEFTAFNGVAAAATARMEMDLMRRADLVIVSSTPLHAAKSRHHARVVLVRHGVDHQLFSQALAAETEVPQALKALPRPILGFFGLVSADWIDVDLLRYLARRMAASSIVLLGSVTIDERQFAGLPNVHLIGRVPYIDLPAYCKGFDVALIPFVRSRLTDNCNPLKVWQYLAAGLPVVSTSIPEVRRLPGCRIGDDRESFAREVEAALQNPGPQLCRSESVRNETWETRLDEIRRHVAALPLMNSAKPSGQP